MCALLQAACAGRRPRRVMAQLVDASNGFQIWSERFDRDLADIFDVQDEIARAIVRRLKVEFAIEDAARLVKVTTTNVEAYEAYLQGRAMLYRRGPWIVKALESFTRAVELDERYAQAWAGLAEPTRPFIAATTVPTGPCRSACRSDAPLESTASANPTMRSLVRRCSGRDLTGQNASSAAWRLIRSTSRPCWYGLFFLSGPSAGSTSSCAVLSGTDPIPLLPRSDGSVLRGHDRPA